MSLWQLHFFQHGISSRPSLTESSILEHQNSAWGSRCWGRMCSAHISTSPSAHISTSVSTATTETNPVHFYGHCWKFSRLKAQPASEQKNKQKKRLSDRGFVTFDRGGHYDAWNIQPRARAHLLLSLLRYDAHYGGAVVNHILYTFRNMSTQTQNACMSIAIDCIRRLNALRKENPCNIVLTSTSRISEYC